MLNCAVVSVAQLVEHRAENSGVAGSSPAQDIIFPNNKVLLKYILGRLNFTFLSNVLSPKNTALTVDGGDLTYLMVHFRLSSTLYPSQLVEILSYETVPPQSGPLNSTSSKGKNRRKSALPTVTVYNLHSLYSQNRVFVFVNSAYDSVTLDSVSELYSSSNWLEREASELSGITFVGKKDSRNLMLQYGDSTTPFKKNFPSVGLREVYYDPLKDALVNGPISGQL